MRKLWNLNTKWIIIITFEKFYREPTSLPGDHTAKQFTSLTLYTHMAQFSSIAGLYGITITVDSFPGTAYACDSLDIKFHNLFDLQGRTWKWIHFFMDIPATSRRRSLSLISTSARGLSFFRTPRALHVCIFSLLPIVSLTILFLYS